MITRHLLAVLEGLLLAVFISIASVSLGYSSQNQAQAQFQSTVGNGTEFVFQQGKEGAYGISGGDIGRTQFGQELFSRHEKEENNLGIGSSTLQTTTVTSEGGKAVIEPFSVTRTQANAVSPSANMSSAIQGFSFSSPALSGITISPTTGLYAGSALTPTYANFGNSTSLAPGGLYQDLNAVPSFSRGASRLSLPSIGTESESDWVLKKGGPQY